MALGLAGLDALLPEEEVRVTKIREFVQRCVDERRIPGAAVAVYSKGETVLRIDVGDSILNEKKVDRTTMFRIYELTQPVTAVAALILFEEGRFGLDDELAWHLPAFEKTRAVRSVASRVAEEANGTSVEEEPQAASPSSIFLCQPTKSSPEVKAMRPVEVEDAAAPSGQQPIRIRDLFTHTAGFVSGSGDSWVDSYYIENEMNPLNREMELADFVEALAGAPLLFEPGTQYARSLASDVLAMLVERLSGKPFDAFCAERIFQPLGMMDTGFTLTSAKAARLAKVFTATPEGELAHLAASQSYMERLVKEHSEKPVNSRSCISGFRGLCSTVDDYLNFAAMLLGGGTLGEVQILAPATVAFMRCNHLPNAAPLCRLASSTQDAKAKGVGIGLCLDVCLDPVQYGVPLTRGSFWSESSTSSLFFADPAREVCAVLLSTLWRQEPPSSDFLKRFMQVVIQAFS